MFGMKLPKLPELTPRPPWVNDPVAYAKKQRAESVRRFKREFFLSIASSGMSVSAADKRAEEMADAVYPEVTEANAYDYI